MLTKIRGALLVPMLLGLCSIAAPAPAQTVQPSADSQSVDQRTRWLSEYLDAYNSGDIGKLGSALGHLYSDPFLKGFGGSEKAAAFRLETFRTAGPLEFVPVPPTENPPIIWTRGRISRAWIGHQIEFDEAGKVERHVIWRTRPPVAPVMDPVPEDRLVQEVRDYLNTMAAADLFSGQVELRKNNQVLLSETYGLRDRNDTPPVTEDTPFNIASVTKLLTVVAALRLVENGVISLDDPISKWIPEYPEPAASRVTLRHLLTHTAGIAFDDDPLYIKEARGARTADDMLRAQLNSAARVGFPFEFGAYKYSSEQIDLVAIIMERATGRPWTELAREYVLDPAGMTHTSFTPPPGRAVGYTFSAADLDGNVTELQPSTAILPPHAKPSSHAWSTARDLARLMRALVEGKLLGPEMTRALLEPQERGEKYALFQLSSWVGLGTQGADDFGVRTVGHGGVVPGYSAVIEYFPATDHLLTIVSHTGEHTAYIVYQRVLEMIHGVPTQIRPSA